MTHTTAFTVNTMELFQALDAGKHAISKDASMDELHCMLFEVSPKEETISLIALDGHCFFKTDLSITSEPVDGKTNFLLQRQDVEQLQSMTKHKNGVVEFEVSSKTIVIKAQYEAVFIPKNFTFPDYHLFLSRTEDYSAQACNFYGFNSNIFTLIGKLTKYLTCFTMGMSKEDTESPVILKGKTSEKVGKGNNAIIIVMPLNMGNVPA